MRKPLSPSYVLGALLSLNVFAANIFACELGSYWYVWKKSFWSLSDAEIKKSAEEMAAQGLGEVYIPLENNFRATSSPSQVERKLKVFRESFLAKSSRSQLKVYAFLNPGLKSLDSPEAAEKLARSAWEMGFEGVHIDIEPVPEGDTRFPKFLQRMATQKPDKSKELSIAAYMLSPSKEEAQKQQAAGLLYWSQDYLKSLLPTLDHLVVMNYDSAQGGQEYSAHTKDQFRQYLNLMKSTPVAWRMGIPTYKFGRQKNKLHPKNENASFAIRGLQEALAGQECPQTFGLSNWLYQEADAEDWKVLRSLGPRSDSQEGRPPHIRN
jgi:hypothetical protein